MTQQVSQEFAKRFGPSGFYLGLRIRFAFPAIEVNYLPASWIDLYSREKFFFVDPALRWSYDNRGAIRWNDLEADDPAGLVKRSRGHGLWYGAVASFNEGDGLRSYGLFYREDREYEDDELALLAAHIEELHRKAAPPTTLTRAEIAVLQRVKAGGRLKQIAHEFGVSEGAIKQRLRNARVKLGASNGTHAAALASEYGLI
ncbi:autoinducer binding domain-containing protein (plasmid) [Limimaricola variabilis]|uniref:helix-turn-helix transcriptional regulator n=1 Tax=Limimaricola variabilis TaxID=1492771 RepID=UPI002AC9DCB7|nr:autoinducer binding domain-containing protein [Limimaricola variabilis]WPY96116.1 autoinducer binding domain-containing protein [Limimaricola variabilis]